MDITDIVDIVGIVNIVDIMGIMDIVDIVGVSIFVDGWTYHGLTSQGKPPPTSPSHVICN